jgi:hypothetical protein
MEVKLEKKEKETDTGGGEMKSVTGLTETILKQRAVAIESIGLRSEARNLGESTNTMVMSSSQKG